jgi:hypothetical protein
MGLRQARNQENHPLRAENRSRMTPFNLFLNRDLGEKTIADALRQVLSTLHCGD